MTTRTTMDAAMRGRIGGTEAALRDRGYERAKANLARANDLDTWRRKYIEQYGECEEPELTEKARLLRTQSQRMGALKRWGKV